MEMLEHEVARKAVVGAVIKKFIVPRQGDRLGPGVIDFELIRRNDYEDRPIYRTRLSDGVLIGHFVGEMNIDEL